MAEDKHFRGLHTALVTPFNDQQEIDREAYKKHLRYQIEGGVNGLVISGTTGESPTLSDEEFTYLIETAVEEAGDDCVVIAGSGANDTRKSVKKSILAEEVGADGLLIVAPYYNKPVQRGIKKHYTEIADAVDIPLIVYNVPGRTSINIEPDTIAELAAHPNIVAVKEASGDIGQVMDIISKVPDDFSVLSGDDSMTLPLIAGGGDGLISVASNEAPELMKQYVWHCLNDEMVSAREFHYKLLPLMNANFWESNPIPVKAALAMMGRMKNILRAPMVPLDIEYEENLMNILEKLELVKAEV